MKVVYREYLNKIKNIEEYIKFLEEEKKIRNMLVHSNNQICCSGESCSLKMHHIEKNTRIDSRIFNFNSIIIGLYGAYENYIENIIVTYLIELNKLISNYRELPDIIVKSNLNLSSELLLETKKAKYSGIDIEDLIINLSGCIKNESNYKLNYKAFAKHDTNLRCDALNNMFNRIGINGICKSIINSKVFKEYYAEEKLIGIEKVPSIVSRRSDKENLNTLERLIEYRNKVAHGSVDETIELNELKNTYVKFMNVIGKSIYEILNESILKYMVKVNGVKIQKIYSANGNILCFNSQNEEVVKGKSIVVKRSENSFKQCKIKSIQIDHREIECVDSSKSEDIGVSLDEKVKSSYEYYFV